MKTNFTTSSSRFTLPTNQTDQLLSKILILSVSKWRNHSKRRRWRYRQASMNSPLRLWHQLKSSLTLNKPILKKHMLWLPNWRNISRKFAWNSSSSRNVTSNNGNLLQLRTWDRARPFKAEKRANTWGLRISWGLLVKFWRTGMRPSRGDFPKAAWFLQHSDCKCRIIYP